jgi:hypothetical protein
VPPEAWDGIVALSGYAGPASRPIEIRFYYLDKPGQHTRGFEVGNEDPEQVRKRANLISELPGQNDSQWSPGPQLDDSQVINFVQRFVEGRPEREAGPRRHLGTAEIEIEGISRAVERWAFMRYPGLLVLRLQLPGAIVGLRGWGLSEGDLLGFASRLQRMELGSDLLARMRDAQAVSDEAWGDWRPSQGE